MVVAQPVSAPLTRAAIFLVVTINSGPENRATVRSFFAAAAGLIRAVEFRDLEAGLSCVIGIGSDAWDRLFGNPGRASPVPGGPVGTTACGFSTGRPDVSYPRQADGSLLRDGGADHGARLAGVVAAIDEVHGFRYFDDRDLLGFVNGTDNPRGQAVIDAALIGEEDAAFAGGSYVIVQKYLHDLPEWNALSTEAQERIIGRTKLADIELDDAVKPTSAHNALITITEDGKELKILRDNMPFGPR